MLVTNAFSMFLFYNLVSSVYCPRGSSFLNASLTGVFMARQESKMWQFVKDGYEDKQMIHEEGMKTMCQPRLRGKMSEA